MPKDEQNIRTELHRLALICIMGMIACVLLFLAIAPAPSAAPPTAPPVSHTPAPEIVADATQSRVIIKIDGKAAVVIDASGLHVEGDLNYGGDLTDVGHGYGVFVETADGFEREEAHQ